MSRAAGVAVLGAAVCLLAAAFEVPALYVPGIAVVLLALASAAAVSVAARLTRIERDLASGCVEEGDVVRVAVALSGHPPSLAGGTLTGWPGADPVALRRLGRAPLELEVRPGRRGRREIGPAVVTFRDPFGLCWRTRRTQACEVLVLPRVERLEGQRLASLGGLRGDGGGRARWLEGADVDGLRPYRDGAPASRIHWPAVARTGELLERRPSNEGAGQPLLVLDARAPDDEPGLDMAVRAAASLCVALARLGGCSLLLPEAPRTESLDRALTRWPALHQRLALVRAGQAPVRGLARGALVIWVAATPPAASPCDYFVSAHAREDRPVLLSVAGCALQPATAAGTARAA